MRNLLGRLNARSAEDLQRIARFWQVPLTGDRGRQIGLLYRTMSDVRAVRTVVANLDAESIHVIRELTSSKEGSLPIPEIAKRTGMSEETAREVAIRLFRNGILAREGDSQELPVGVLPRLFLPRELGLVFRRVQDEIEAGDVSSSPFRVLLQLLDSTSVEEAATRWGINVIPGLRSRDELIGQILRQMTADRVKRLVDALHPDARRIWDVMRSRSLGGTLLLEDVLSEAKLIDGEIQERSAPRVREALDQLESSLLVMHTYDREGRRSLFVAREIAQPQEAVTTIPLRTLTAVPEDEVTGVRLRHAHALAWDLLTMLREIANHGAPIWVPGEPVSRSWQRRLNSRLWFGGDDLPPDGYLGFLLQLGLSIGLIQRSAPPPGTHADRHAIVPMVSPMMREWRSRSFAEQGARLRTAWLSTNDWVEARERGDVEVWGPDWRGFRKKLLESIAEMEHGSWFILRDLSESLAESDPALIGTSMTVASSRAGDRPDDTHDGRVTATAQVIRLEFETALTWFGLVESGSVQRKGLAIQVSERGRSIARDSEAVEPAETPEGPALTLTEAGRVTVTQPTPLHVWSMSAFADLESLSGQPVFQLRSGSVGRAIGAGFDLDQIVTYLKRHTGRDLPAPLATSLQEWSAGFKRVRMRRAIQLTPDAGTSREDLERIVREAGLEIVPLPESPGTVHAVFPTSDDEGAEESLLAALRAGGFLGQWAMPAASASKPRSGT
jgi:hypothetical protein